LPPRATAERPKNSRLAPLMARLFMRWWQCGSAVFIWYRQAYKSAQTHTWWPIVYRQCPKGFFPSLIPVLYRRNRDKPCGKYIF
jgi:hypothetical protein